MPNNRIDQVSRRHDDVTATGQHSSLPSTEPRTATGRDAPRGEDYGLARYEADRAAGRIVEHECNPEPRDKARILSDASYKLRQDEREWAAREIENGRAATVSVEIAPGRSRAVRVTSMSEWDALHVRHAVRGDA